MQHSSPGKTLQEIFQIHRVIFRKKGELSFDIGEVSHTNQTIYHNNGIFLVLPRTSLSPFIHYILDRKTMSQSTLIGFLDWHHAKTSTMAVTLFFLCDT